MNNTCPFKVIDEIGAITKRIRRKWVALTMMIDYENQQYLSIQPFHDDWIEDEKEYIKREHKLSSRFDTRWIRNLITVSLDSTPIFTYENRLTVYDVIRNPTVDEYNFLKTIFQMNGYKFNKKTNELDKFI